MEQLFSIDVSKATTSVNSHRYVTAVMYAWSCLFTLITGDADTALLWNAYASLSIRHNVGCEDKVWAANKQCTSTSEARSPMHNLHSLWWLAHCPCFVVSMQCRHCS